MLTKAEFDHLFDRYVDDVTSFLYGYASGKAQLKDWVQEVFVKLWERREQIDFKHPGFKGYLLKTARNHALKKLQKEKRYGDWLQENLVRLTELHGFQKPSNGHSDFKELYTTALAKIPERSREAYLLSREEGLTYPEIADVMDVSVKTVEAQISRALRVLREELKDYS